MKMNFLVFFLLFFFLFLIIYQIYLYYSEYGIEGLTPMNPDISGNTLSPISLVSLQKEVQDLSGNVGDLQTQVNTILQSQSAYLNKNAPAEPNISLQAIS